MRHSVFALLACVAACASTEATRRVDDHTVISRTNPAARFIVDPSFDYLGRTEGVVMDGRATAERFWFGKIESGRLTQAIIIHFEHWNDGVDGTFDYPTFRMRRLGANDYLHQSFPAPDCSPIADVRALLAQRGATAAPGCMMTRFVRAIGDDKRAEIILFYVEPGDVAEQPPEGFAPGGLPAEHNRPGAAQTPWGAIDARLTQRALSLLEVAD